jgi:acyl-CoA hydrolase
MDHQAIYRNKLISNEAALAKVKTGDHIVVALAGAEPQGFMSALHTLAPQVKEVVVSTCLNMQNYPFFVDPAMKGHFINEGWFYNPAMRKAHQQHTVSYIPNHLHFAATKRLFHRKPNLFVGTCTPPDQHGFVSLGLSVTYEQEMIENADIVILEVNANLPRTLGDTALHVSEVDFFIEHTLPVPTLSIVEPSEKDRIIGGYIAELVEDGSTIQLGIGGIPNAVAQGLMQKKDLGVHTEMFTDGMVDLYEAGVITSSKKTLHRGKMVAAFALGTKKLYDFIDDNPAVAILRGSYVVDPYVIGKNYKMVSINTTLEIDLTGQCCSESIGHSQFSGTGGQADTAIGAQLSPGGKSIIALYSTAKNDTISKIVPLLSPGAVVSLQRNDVDFVVTEYGVAQLRGTSIRDRVKRLITIAHPNFRDQLADEAEKLQLW